MKKALLMAALVLGAGPALAAQPFEGKWGPDTASCEAEPTFTLTARSIDSPTFGCRQVAYRGAAGKWSAKAKQCYAEGDDAATSMTFDVLVSGGKLQIDWGKDGRSDELVRCGQ